MGQEASGVCKHATMQPEGESQENSSEDDGSEDRDIKKFCFVPSAKVTDYDFHFQLYISF